MKKMDVMYTSATSSIKFLELWGAVAQGQSPE